MTTLYITTDDRDSLREETLERVRTAAADESDETDDPWGEKTVLAFPSYDVLTKHLTPLRLELVRAIAEHEPESVSETADLVDRDVGDVSRDIQRLDAIGMIDVNEGGPGKPTRPIVPYDRIEVHVDYPLVEETDGDGVTAGAD